MSGSQVAHREPDDPGKQLQRFIDRFDPADSPAYPGCTKGIAQTAPYRKRTGMTVTTSS